MCSIETHFLSYKPNCTRERPCSLSLFDLFFDWALLLSLAFLTFELKDSVR